MEQEQIDWGDLPPDMVEGFWKFHNENPQVLQELVVLARGLVASGRKHIGMGMLFEVLRWHTYMETNTDEPFKLNNNYRAFYTRLIERVCPDLDGVFTKRRSVSDEALAA